MFSSTSMERGKYMVHVLIYETPILYIVPIVETSLQCSLYRIHNIPLAHPVLKKSNNQEEYLAIRSESQYISFCHITSPLYMADTSKSCSYTLFPNDKTRINCVCILSVINQTHNEAININEIFWTISSLQDDKNLYITCLQFRYTIKLCFP